MILLKCPICGSQKFARVMKEVIKKCPCVQFVVSHLTRNNYINVPIAKDMNVQLTQLMHMIRSFIVPIVVKIYNCKLEITEELNRSFSIPFYPPHKKLKQRKSRDGVHFNFLNIVI